jgi:2-haloacid dehalogenase
MRNYESFALCTSHALEYACQYYKVNLTSEQKQELLERYRKLPAFNDAKEGLVRLNESGHRLYAFSNGHADAVEQLLQNAGIRHHFIDVISVDGVKSFKPNPDVYNYFLKQAAASIDRAWLISSNPFDVIGAVSAGLSAAWVKRSDESIYDPWGIEPTIIVQSLKDLADRLIIV